jgi:hypothetical protein
MICILIDVDAYFYVRKGHRAVIDEHQDINTTFFSVENKFIIAGWERSLVSTRSDTDLSLESQMRNHFYPSMTIPDFS